MWQMAHFYMNRCSGPGRVTDVLHKIDGNALGVGHVAHVAYGVEGGVEGGVDLDACAPTEATVRTS